MAVGIVGAGRMGTALARALDEAGVPVLICGVRAPTRRECPPLSWASLDEVWRRCAPVILAARFPAAAALATGPAGQMGRGRTLVDVSNPGWSPERAEPCRSGAELIAAGAPTWRVVKAFNTVAADQVRACRMAGEPVTIPVAGVPAAKEEVGGLIRRLGFEPVDAGGLDGARHLEALAVLLERVSAAGGLRGRIGVRIGRLDEVPSPAPAT